jgi:DNA-binding transcriptional regulator YhcF (GntR family)
MNYNFTDQVRQALARAREEAIELRHEAVGTEHILLGVIADPAAAGILQALGVRADEVRGAIRARVTRGTWVMRGSSPAGLREELPYTSRAKKVLEFTMAEARQSGATAVDTKQVLLGVVREGKGLGAEVLRQFGVTLENLRTAEPGVSSRSSAIFQVQIDDASDRSIYQQIIDQITEAIATGALRPGERLPTVRQLADELDVAPGTVARSYSELERRSLVVTEGARGTRVAEPAAAPGPDLDRPEALAGLLRPVAVAAFHLGASAAELRTALEVAMRGIFDKGDQAA